MIWFFSYDNPFINTERFYSLTFLEWIIPLTIVNMIILLLVIYRVKIKTIESLDIILRYLIGSILILLFVSHFLLIWINDGINKNNLPLSFYSLSVIFTVILMFTKSKRLFPLVLYTGVIGGMVNLLTNQVGYSYEYFRYYQFMISQGLLIIGPLYFIIIHEFRPSLISTLFVLLKMEVIIIVIFVLNSLLNTDYLFLTWGENQTYDNMILADLGAWPKYFIYLELIGIFLMAFLFILIHFSFNYYEKVKSKRIEKSGISKLSMYMTKKKRN